MKNYIIILFLSAFVLFACSESEEYKPKKSKGIPAAFQERSVDVSGLKKKDTDLIEVLYKEILDKDPGLQQLEKEITQLNDHKDDSLKNFASYDKNNIDYYSIYEQHLSNIKDSVLKKSMKILLDSSTLRYKKKIAAQRAVYDSANTRYNMLADLHWLLKLSKTLEVMERYQDNNIPDTLTLNNSINQLNNTIDRTDSLVKLRDIKQPR
ncbi:hypothetical protein I5907_09295 [Panacibacter sp. DH6]|uniref:Lipoprotein n=1 Tax=Panacibacter microcysteis TaxID=2793269 RepID=A0A931E599_9BACT|nr:hypothetical protein [Panacibacter microcysteis]MBG9376427.1 hypothetical protein [Panacibacter microcysteis]